MANYALINKEVIPYVCDKKRVSIEYLAERSNFSLEQITRWLDVSDPSLPTIIQAKKLAACIHIPFAALYMNTSDIKVNTIPSIKNFRTIDGSLYIDDSYLNIAICDVLLERRFLIDEGKEVGLSIPSLSFFECLSNNPVDWAKKIREHFRISIKDQYNSKSARQLYLYLRERIESNGVFVQCFSNVPVDVVRGFSVYYPSLPVIGINDDDRPPAKSFTLIHELVHLLKKDSSVCNEMYKVIPSHKEEVFCNAVAGELLVPKSELLLCLQRYTEYPQLSLNEIDSFSKRFSVSREVIVRRLLDIGIISSSEFDNFSKLIKDEFEREKEEMKQARAAGYSSPIPLNVSRNTFDKASPFVSKVFLYGFNDNYYTKRDIARHFGINQKHIDKYLLEVSKWNN